MKANEQIEVTQEMLEAGAAAIMGFDPEGYTSVEGAERVYRAMELARLASDEKP